MQGLSVYMIASLIIMIISALIYRQLLCTGSTEKSVHGLEPSLLRCDAQMRNYRKHVVRSAKNAIEVGTTATQQVYFTSILLLQCQALCILRERHSSSWHSSVKPIPYPWRPDRDHHALS
jgi:hypothetical protein